MIYVKSKQQSLFGNQLHIKRAALARAQRVSPNLAFVRLDNAGGNKQPNASAQGVHFFGLFTSLKLTAKHISRLFFGHANTSVGHNNHGAIIFAFGHKLQLNFHPALLGIFNRVIGQVIQGLAQFDRVSHNQRGGLWGQALGHDCFPSLDFEWGGLGIETIFG